jgi:hypothetical protein
MRYHHGYGCHGEGGWHYGCGDPYWGPRFGYCDDPAPYPRRARLGGAFAARGSTAAQLETYLAGLRDEVRAVEQDLQDLQGSESTAPEA